MATKKFLITIGIPGSGKSTWVEANIKPRSNWVIVSSDEVRKELTGSVDTDVKKNKEVWDLVKTKIVEALKNGFNVCLDSTAVKSVDRNGYAKLFQDNNIECKMLAKLFTCSVEEAKDRIANDIKNKIERSNVPDFIVDKMCANFLADISKIKSDGYTVISGTQEELK